MDFTFNIKLYMLNALLIALNDFCVVNFNLYFNNDDFGVDVHVHVSDIPKNIEYSLQWLAERMSEVVTFKSYESFDVYTENKYFRVANYDNVYVDDFTTFVRFYD